MQGFLALSIKRVAGCVRAFRLVVLINQFKEYTTIDYATEAIQLMGRPGALYMEL